ncbi:unnamed protein product [Strongylus vulgaris]|uniref:Protein kinase domain-containing protein n=1 Tax=Strongylus vulgaris TaxID=40348 RepID=A0A3P7J5Z6_STRVU|nr:unnamed protein product [Strongylus vulgaris]
MVFERRNNVKAPPRIGRMNKFALVDLIKYEVSQLSALAHPRILHVQHALEDSKYEVSQLSALAHPRILHVQHALEDSKEFLAFATESVCGSLDTIVIEEGVERLEMKLGVLQNKEPWYSHEIYRKNYRERNGLGREQVTSMVEADFER